MTSLRTSSDYDRFARVYNLHWGSYAMRVVPTLEYLVLRHLPEQAAVMDLCCGTGQLARLSEGTPTAKGRWRDTQDRVGRMVGTVGDTHHRFATGERRTNCSLSAKRRLRSSRGRCPEWIARTHPLQRRPSRP